jgi:hypothetical protein
MVCALHRLFQKPEDDRIMEGDFDPAEERKKQGASARLGRQQAGRVVRRWKSLFSQVTAGLRRRGS